MLQTCVLLITILVLHITQRTPLTTKKINVLFQDIVHSEQESDVNIHINQWSDSILTYYRESGSCEVSLRITVETSTNYSRSIEHSNLLISQKQMESCVHTCIMAILKTASWPCMGKSFHYSLAHFIWTVTSFTLPP